jgi:hypothetical protein
VTASARHGHKAAEQGMLANWQAEKGPQGNRCVISTGGVFVISTVGRNLTHNARQDFSLRSK